MRVDWRKQATRGVVPLCVLAAGILFSGGAPAPGGEPSGLPNVIVIQTDDQTLESMRVMKETEVHLAKRGATFRNHVTNLPACCPARATLLTGQYAHNHGVRSNRPPRGGFENFDDTSTLPVWLQSRGYVTAHVGKYLNGYGELPPPEAGGTGPDQTYVPPGWDEWYTAPTQNVYDYELNENGTMVPYGSAERDFKQDVFTERAVQLISEHAGSPLYLQLDYTAPHGAGPDPNPRPPGDCSQTAKPAPRHAREFDEEPLPMPPSFNEQDVSDKPQSIKNNDLIDEARLAKITKRYRCRLESLLSVDEGVAEVMQALNANDALDSTYVIFTSDNGYFHGEHRIAVGKKKIYEPAVRIPLVIRGPGIPEGIEVDELTTNADVAPTILDAADTAAGLTLDGRSLFGPMAEPKLERGRELLIEVARFRAIRTARYVWVEYSEGDRELYDLKKDPYQLKSLHKKRRAREVRTRLRDRLAELRSCSGASCRLTPELKPKLEFDEGQNCAKPRIRAGFTGADKREIALAEFFADGELVDRDRSRPFKYRYRRRDLGRNSSTLFVRATLIDGRRASWEDELNICR